MAKSKTKMELLKESILYCKEGPTCSNCGNFTSKIEKITRWGGSYNVESNLKCSKHKFTTKKRCYCKDWISK